MAKFAEKVKKRPLSCLQGHPVPAPARLPEKKPEKLLTPHSQGRKQPRNHGVSCRGSMRAHDFFKSPCLRTDGSRTSSAHHAESRKAEGGAEYRRRNGSSKSQEPRLRTFSGVTMSVRNIFGHVAACVSCQFWTDRRSANRKRSGDSDNPGKAHTIFAPAHLEQRSCAHPQGQPAESAR